jgi:hypothetical protein
MAGDDRRRFCGRCSLHVHDLSAMREEAVMKLLAGPDPQLCIRYSVRGDGTAVIGGESRLRVALRVVGLVAVSLWFWATVVLVQLPWLALTRRVQPASAAARPQQAERDRKELELKRRAAEERARMMTAIKSEQTRGYSQGGMPKHDRHRFVREAHDRRQHSKKK